MGDDSRGMTIYLWTIFLHLQERARGRKRWWRRGFLRFLGRFRLTNGFVGSVYFALAVVQVFGFNDFFIFVDPLFHAILFFKEFKRTWEFRFVCLFGIMDASSFSFHFRALSSSRFIRVCFR